MHRSASARDIHQKICAARCLCADPIETCEFCTRPKAYIELCDAPMVHLDGHSRSTQLATFSGVDGRLCRQTDMFNDVDGLLCPSIG